MAAWQQTIDEGTAAHATETMRQAQALAGGAEPTLSDLAERYQAAGKADAVASASEAASHCRPAIYARRRVQQAAAA